MPRAVRGTSPPHRSRNVRKISCIPGVLIECDPSIKSIIVNIDDNENHQYIIQDLDEERVVVMENMVTSLKDKLEKVRICLVTASQTRGLANGGGAWPDLGNSG
jgi:TFIIH basal transcription factor complex TTD-A subunit